MRTISLLCTSLLALSLQPAAASTTFSFITDTWTNGGSTQTGYLNNSPSGTLSKGGITLTFQNSFAGTSTAATRNLTLDSGNPTGFVFGSNTDANNLNGTLANYQRLDFSFSQPVLIDRLILDDIDSDNNNPLPSTGGFRDAIAAEGFSTATPGAIGTGLDVTFSLQNPTGLIQGVMAAGSGQSVNYVISAPASNPNNAPVHRAAIGFGTTPVSSFSIYSFSDRSRSHRVTLFQGIVEITPVTLVPEPTSVLLGLLGLPVLARRRRVS